MIRGARSGNSNFDPVTGKFARKGGKDPQGPAEVDVNPVSITRSDLPQGVTQEEWERRLDIVRLAARSHSTMDGDSAAAFLKGHVNDLSQVDVNQFIIDVRATQLDDFVDILDHQLRGRLSQKNSVRLVASKPWSKKVFNGLTDDEVRSIVTRLLNKGWTAAAVKKNVIKKISDPERRAQLEQAVS